MAQSDISLLIKLNVESAKNAIEQLKQSIKGVNNANDASGDKQGLEKSTKATKEIAENTQKASKSADLFKSAMTSDALLSVSSQLQGTFSALTGDFTKLDTATAAIKTLGTDAKELAPSLRAAALEMSETIPFSASQIQEAMGNALASGVQGGAKELSGFADVAAKLAVGGGAEIADVVKGLGATLNAFGATANDAGKYADTFFNAVNFGVTSIPELNQYLSGVTPTAAAAGVSFDNVAASLALMTQKGVPTSQATTKLNALLIELQKPGGDLTKILNKAGISVEQLGKTMKDEGLPKALDLVQTAFNKAGKSATQAFSSSESASAFNVLQGEAGQFAKFLDDVATTSGSAQNAYDEMSQTIEVRTKQAQASFDAFKTKAVDSLGSFGVSSTIAMAQFGQLAPQIMAVASISPLIGNVGKAAFESSVSIVQKLIPSLFTTNGAFVGLRSASAIATSGVITFAKAATAAALSNPFTAIAAAAVLAGVAIYAVVQALKETHEEQLENVQAEKQVLDTKKKQVQESQKQSKSNKTLLDEYIRLGQQGKRTAEEEKRMTDIKEKLQKTYPNLIDGTKNFSDNLSALQAQSKKSADEINNFSKELDSLNKQASENAQKTLFIQSNIEFENVKDALPSAFNVNSAKRELREQASSLINEIFNAKTANDIEKKKQELITKLGNAQSSGLIDAKDYNSAFDALQKATQLRVKAIEFYAKKADEAEKKVEKKEETKTKKVDDEKLKAEQEKELKRLKEKADNEIKILAQKAKEQEEIQERNRLNERRLILTDEEKIKAESDKLQLLTKQKKVITDTYNVILDDKDTVLSIKAEISTDAKKDVKEIVTDYQNNIKAQENNFLKTKIELSPIKFDESQSLAPFKSLQEQTKAIREELNKQMQNDNPFYLNTLQSQAQARYDAIKAQFEREQKLIEDNYDAELISRERADKLIAEAKAKADNAREIAEKENAKIALELYAKTAGEAALLFKENTLAFKTLSIAQAMIATYTAANKTLLEVPFPFSLVSMAVTIAAGLANVAKIAGIGFKKGGYTGQGGKDDVAGVVHSGEFVFTATQTAKNRKAFEEMHRRNMTVEEFAREKLAPLLESVNISIAQTNTIDTRNLEKRLETIADKLDTLESTTKRTAKVYQSHTTSEVKVKVEQSRYKDSW